MAETDNSNLVDPFQGRSILFLNPRTFPDAEIVQKSNDLEAIHQHMSSMALRSPDKHYEKARSIVHGGSELLNAKESQVNAKNMENRQERRPALARKRARFSLKPDTSQPSTTVEPSFQVDQLQGPEEFFAAFEKLENTRKEMIRQKGGEELNEVKFSMTARPRRPDISGRNVSYKHHDYTMHAKYEIPSSQETLQENIRSPPTQYLQQETVISGRESQEEELSGSVSKAENRVDKLFDELISSDINGLDGDETLSLLKDHLKIKPVEIDDLRLPDFLDVGRMSSVSPVKNMSKDKNRYSDTCTLPDGLRGKTPAKQKTLSDSPLSPTPPRSPLMAMSMFGKRMLKSVLSMDPFSTQDIDSSPTRSPIKISGRQSADIRKEEVALSGTLDSPKKVTNTATGASINSSDKSLNDNMHGRDGINLTESLIGLEDREQGLNMEEQAVHDSVTSPLVHKHTQINEGISTEGNAEAMVPNGASVTQLNINMDRATDDVQPHTLNDIEENVEDVLQKEGSSTVVEADSDDITMMENGQNNDQTAADATKNHAASEPSQIPEIVPEQQIEQHPRTSTNKRKKTRSRAAGQKKKRQSLAEAGTSWTSGVRRSNRVRRRPLEYWKGERFLYGRVHNSLPTVIGLKYISPTKDNGKPGFKVESFVSERYKDLVELAALH